MCHSSWPCDSSRSPTQHWPGSNLKPVAQLGPWRYESSALLLQTDEQGSGGPEKKPDPKGAENRYIQFDIALNITNLCVLHVEIVHHHSFNFCFKLRDRISLSTASTILHASGILTLCPLNATLLINEVTKAMILSGVDLYSEVYQEFLLLRQFFDSS